MPSNYKHLLEYEDFTALNEAKAIGGLHGFPTDLSGLQDIIQNDQIIISNDKAVKGNTTGFDKLANWSKIGKKLSPTTEIRVGIDIDGLLNADLTMPGIIKDISSHIQRIDVNLVVLIQNTIDDYAGFMDQLKEIKRIERLIGEPFYTVSQLEPFSKQKKYTIDFGVAEFLHPGVTKHIWDKFEGDDDQVDAYNEIKDQHFKLLRKYKLNDYFRSYDYAADYGHDESLLEPKLKFSDFQLNFVDVHNVNADTDFDKMHWVAYFDNHDTNFRKGDKMVKNVVIVWKEFIHGFGMDKGGRKEQAWTVPGLGDIGSYQNPKVIKYLENKFQDWIERYKDNLDSAPSDEFEVLKQETNIGKKAKEGKKATTKIVKKAMGYTQYSY